MKKALELARAESTARCSLELFELEEEPSQPHLPQILGGLIIPGQPQTSQSSRTRPAADPPETVLQCKRRRLHGKQTLPAADTPETAPPNDAAAGLLPNDDISSASRQ